MFESNKGARSVPYDRSPIDPTPSDPEAAPEAPDRGGRVQRPRVGVALGGGSARGYAHIGVLAALERRDLAPDVLVGTSFGAVIGALYALGHDPARLRADAERLRRRDVLPRIVDVGARRGALFAGVRLGAYFESLVGDARIEALPRTLAVVATDLDTGERVVLREGPLALALRASASLPGLFAPVPWEGRRLIDGGIGAPVPLETLAGFDVDLAIGVGAGIEARDSRTLRAARRAASSRAGRWTSRALRGRRPVEDPRGQRPWRTLGRALALTFDAWGDQADALPEGDGGVHLQTRPPIHWLGFDRAAEAIVAGDAAFERAWPRFGAWLADWRDPVAPGATIAVERS
ncbi:MAG: patatin-like phospholipase family protein [Trueperaceae bacterium]